MKSTARHNRYLLPAGRSDTAGATGDARRARRPGPARATRLSPGGDDMTSDDVLAPNSDADQLRQQLLQAQRLSSVGALASSVAHEFNNILTTIINYAKLGLKPTADEPARTQALERILKGGQRAAAIVNSMLGYARANATHREPTDLARLVEEALIL